MPKVIAKQVPTPVDYESLNKFLLGTIAEIKREEITIEKAQAIAQLADKVIKNNLSRVLYDKELGISRKNEFFEPKNLVTNG